MKRTTTENKISAKKVASLFLSLTLAMGLFAVTPLRLRAEADDKTTAWKNTFTDVKEDDGFYDDVAFAVQNGLIEGASATAFAPQTPATRGAFVTALFRLDAPAKGPDTTDFTDVPLYEYYSSAVAWATANGIVSGYGNGTFGPNDNITREQAATVFTRYMVYKEINIDVTEQYILFADESQISDYAKNVTQTMKKLGVIDFAHDNAVNPKGTVTRAEAAGMFRRFAEIVKSAKEEKVPAIVGGYSAERELTAEDVEIFNAAIEKLVGVKYEPLKVATQVVAGTNYSFYCKATNVTPNAEERYVYVTIFKPLPHTGEPAVVKSIEDIAE